MTDESKFVYIPFSILLNPGQGLKVYEPRPLVHGRIVTIQIHWPDGCNGLVGVAAWYGRSVQLVPREQGYLALNDATPTYPVDQVKSDNEEVWVDAYNQDALNQHRITVTYGIMQ